MDRLIRTAWRAFWVGLGASAVLVSQSLLAPAPSPGSPQDHVDPAPVVAPAPNAAGARSTDPVLTRVVRVSGRAGT
jgi:hypothetical protein